MIYRTITFFLFLSLIGQQVRAQDLSTCRNLVAKTAQAINDNSPAAIESHLAPGFSIAGQEGDLALHVLKQLLGQLDETVQAMHETEQTQADGSLTLSYDFDYSKLGTRPVSFSFDSENRITTMSLIQMRVKTTAETSTILLPEASSIAVPFTRAGKLILVDVMVNGQPKKFLLDSGAPKVILNQAYYPNDTAGGQVMGSSKGVNGTVNNMGLRKVNHLSFAGIQMQEQELITMNLSHLEEELSEPVHGLIGYELIKDYDLLFDYKAKQLTLIQPESWQTYKADKPALAQGSSIPFELEGHIPVIKAQVGDRELSFGLDCGAEGNLIDDDLYEPLEASVKPLKADDLIGAGGEAKTVQRGKVKQTNIGDRSYKNMRTAFSDISHLNAGYNLQLDGLMGYELLSKQKTLLSYKRKELILL